MAIKSGICDPLRIDHDKECFRDLLDEAKTMASIEQYHDNIVNLQGLMVDGPQKVRKSFLGQTLRHSILDFAFQ